MEENIINLEEFISNVKYIEDNRQRAMVYPLAIKNASKEQQDSIEVALQMLFDTLFRIDFYCGDIKKLEHLNDENAENEFITLRTNLLNTLKDKAIFKLIYYVCQTVKNDNSENMHTENFTSLYENLSTEAFVRECLTTIMKASNLYTQLFTTNLSHKIEQKSTEIKETEVRLKAIEKHIEELHSKSGVSSFAITYKEIATKENIAKILWLIVTIIFTGIAVASTLYSLYSIYFITNTINLLERLPWTFILLIVALWTSHRYSVARRNHLIYRHLASTLSTFKAFENSVDKEHKSLLLFEIAKVLFPPPVDKRTENQKELASMIDLVKTLNTQSMFAGKNSKNDE